MFKSCGLGGQWIDTRNGHSSSDRTFTQGLKIIGKKPHAFVFCALEVLALCSPSRQSQLHVALLCSMMTSLTPPKRYMATIALRAPGCSQPSRHRWHAFHPSWVGLRTTREREREREPASFRKIVWSTVNLVMELVKLVILLQGITYIL